MIIYNLLKMLNSSKNKNIRRTLIFVHQLKAIGIRILLQYCRKPASQITLIAEIASPRGWKSAQNQFLFYQEYIIKVVAGNNYHRLHNIRDDQTPLVGTQLLLWQRSFLEKRFMIEPKEKKHYTVEKYYFTLMILFNSSITYPDYQQPHVQKFSNPFILFRVTLLKLIHSSVV